MNGTKEREEELTYLEMLLCQPINRWDGFDLTQPEESEQNLRVQVLFTGIAIAALGLQPDATPEQQQRARVGVVAALERMVQRRIWAHWATPIDREGLVPDPIGAGFAAYSGALATLLGLAALLGEERYHDPPLEFRWSSTWRFSYTYAQLVGMLAAQMRADHGGAIATTNETTTPSAMALVLWGVHLADHIYGSEHTSAGQRWLQVLREQLVLRGPRLPNRGVFASGYNLKRRKATLTSNSLEDVMSLILMAPYASELTRELAVRHWPAVKQPERINSPLLLAFSSILATELGETERANALSLAASTSTEGATSPNWIEALLILGRAGGMPRLPEPRPAKERNDGNVLERHSSGL
ncbi:MAG: hypothetical protein EOM24_13305 [Chloroflexia bacterium]|nr:hypothetical protein [Chloroflexia bacterium]